MKKLLLVPAILVVALLAAQDLLSHPAPASPPTQPQAGRDRPPPLLVCLLNSPYCLTLAGVLAVGAYRAGPAACRAALAHLEAALVRHGVFDYKPGPPPPPPAPPT
jgi:hypothetical protein